MFFESPFLGFPFVRKAFFGGMEHYHPPRDFFFESPEIFFSTWCVRIKYSSSGYLVYGSRHVRTAVGVVGVVGIVDTVDTTVGIIGTCSSR